MPIAKSHGNPDKDKRVAKPSSDGRGGFMAKTKVYKAVEEVIDQVYCDIANGRTKTEIIKMLKDGHYGKTMQTRNAQDYYNAAVDRFCTEKNEQADKLRAIYFGRFETLYRDAIQKGDIYNANNILQSVCRIFGLEAPKSPETAIQINNDKDGVTINFGFKKEEDIKETDED